MDLANMIRLFASGAIASLMAKNLTNFLLSNIAIFQHYFAEVEMTIDLLTIFYKIYFQDYT